MASQPVSTPAVVTALLLWSTARQLPVISRKRSGVKGSYIATKHTAPRAPSPCLCLQASGSASTGLPSDPQWALLTGVAVQSVHIFMTDRTGVAVCTQIMTNCTELAACVRERLGSRRCTGEYHRNIANMGHHQLCTLLAGCSPEACLDTSTSTHQGFICYLRMFCEHGLTLDATCEHIASIRWFCQSTGTELNATCGCSASWR